MKNKGKQGANRKLSPQTSIETSIETTIETTIENLGAGTRVVYEAILSEPTNNLEQIAEKTGISFETVRYHIKQNYKKLGVKTKSEALIAARELGFL